MLKNKESIEELVNELNLIIETKDLAAKYADNELYYSFKDLYNRLLKHKANEILKALFKGESK